MIRIFTPEEVAENARIYNLKYELGLMITYYDDSTAIRASKYIPSMYESSFEYNRDKSLAKKLIEEHKEIPQDLYNRLVQARKELQERGLY